MGTVNYATSDYITMGLVPYDFDDFVNDPNILESMEEYGTTAESEVFDYITICYENDYSNIEGILSRYPFHYYHVSIKPGYYEGFSLDIENNFPFAFDSWLDRAEAQKEITQIKKMLLECVGVGLVECSPGWCTRYSNHEETCNAISNAIKDMREEVRKIPTFLQYERMKAST